ncbi:hypothetical protein CCM_02701 [Cordyceps militaris CM01]|uniref:Uncharacterized protein n=1 Tax=Cordyceps militaris (strain CM01) TaxID=983644 RepID=G3JB70_CORMM|nr:uncharacterized protein CCM_02701 [Cordyceps militaris CM01]EGX94430.1 hypothetical protein CCM_02701 [Cordyceps militaris CM01]
MQFIFPLMSRETSLPTSYPVTSSTTRHLKNIKTMISSPDGPCSASLDARLQKARPQ